MPLYAPFKPSVGFAEQSAILATPGAGTQIEYVDAVGRQWLKLSNGRLIYSGRYPAGRQFVATATNNSTTVAVLGTGSSEDGTATALLTASTNLFTRQCRVESLSAASSAANCGRRCTQSQYLSDAGVAFVRFGIEAFQTNMAMFAGLRPSGVHGNVDPSSFTNILGVGIDSGQTTLRLLSNDGAGTATAVDLGVNFPANTSATDFYELMLWWDDAAASVKYQIIRLNTGHVAQGTISSDLPVSTQIIQVQLIGNTRAGTSAMGLSWTQMGGESF